MAMAVPESAKQWDTWYVQKEWHISPISRMSPIRSVRRTCAVSPRDVRTPTHDTLLDSSF